MLLITPIIDMLITNQNNRPFKENNPLYLAVHWTANENKGANAVANAKYFQNTDRQASAHYIVDDKQIVRCIPENEVAYGVGASKYTTWSNKNIGSYPNGKVISIEMCVNSDGNFWNMYSNTAHLCADILKRNNWDIDKLIRHFDVTGKNCPAFFVSDDYAKKYTGKNANEAWSNFKNDVKKLLQEEEKVSDSYVGYKIIDELPIILDGEEIKLKAPKIEIKGVGGVTFLPIRDFLQDIIRDKFGIDLEVGYDGRVLLNSKKKQ